MASSNDGPQRPFLNPNFNKSIVECIVFIIYVAFTHTMGGYYFVEKFSFVKPIFLMLKDL